MSHIGQTGKTQVSDYCDTLGISQQSHEPMGLTFIGVVTNSHKISVFIFFSVLVTISILQTS